MIEDSIRGEDIVCVGFADWQNQLLTNQHHLRSRLGELNRVRSSSRFGLRRPQLAGSDLRRIDQRLDKTLGGLRTISDVHAISPPVIPLRYESVDPGRQRQAAALVRGEGDQAPGGSGTDPVGLRAAGRALIEDLRPSAASLITAWTILPPTRALTRRASGPPSNGPASRADLVVASARPLADRMRPAAKNCVEALERSDVDFFASGARVRRDRSGARGATAAEVLLFTGAVVSTGARLRVDRGGRSRATRVELCARRSSGRGRPEHRRRPAGGGAERLHAGWAPLQSAASAGAAWGGCRFDPLRSQRPHTQQSLPDEDLRNRAAGLPIVSTSLLLEDLEDVTFADDPASTVRCRPGAALAEDSPGAGLRRSRAGARTLLGHPPRGDREGRSRKRRGRTEAPGDEGALRRPRTDQRRESARLWTCSTPSRRRSSPPSRVPKAP